MHFSFNFFSVSCNLNVCSSMLRQITIQIPHVCSFRKQQNVCVPTVHLFLEQEEYITFMHFLSPPSLQCFGNDVRNHFPLALLKSGLKKIRGTFSCIHCNKNLFGVRAVLDQILNTQFKKFSQFEFPAKPKTSILQKPQLFGPVLTVTFSIQLVCNIFTLIFF